MRKRHIPEIREGGVNVTPLIDVVMCLIIFFMLVAKIGVDAGNDVAITVPPAAIGVDIKDLGNTLTLNVSNGPAQMGDKAQPSITYKVKGEQQELKVRTEIGGQASFPLYQLLKTAKDGDPHSSLPPNPDFKVIIRADQNTQYQFIQPVLAECTRAGVTYDFATQNGETFTQ